MRTIKLFSYGIGRYDDVSPFIIADNIIELKIELPNINGEFYLIAQNNGKTVKKPLSKYEPIKIEELTAGELKAEVKHYLKGILIKTYKIEPLLLKEVDGSISAIPEIKELKNQIKTLSESYESLKKEQSVFVEKIRLNIYALIRFAFTDYKNNVYLSGKGFNDFLKEFGFNLTNDEISFFNKEQE